MLNRYRNPIRNRFPVAPAALLVCALGLTAISTRADEVAEKGRAIFKQHEHSVVTVEIVIKSKLSMGGMGAQANESRQDVTGTVMDPSGLTVVSLMSIDPEQMMQSVLGGMGGDESKFKMETELSDVKILLQDGSELPAEVVLRDRDLDLAFIRPKTKPASPLPPVDMAQSGKAQVLDQVIAVNRLGTAAARAYSATVERIAAVVERPRLFYVPETSLTSTALGSPAFTLDGKFLGLFVVRAVKSAGGGSLMAMASQQNNLTGIIVPADDILKAAKQVPPAGEPKK